MSVKSKKKATAKDECADCNGLCCRDLAMMITKPRTRAEINDVRWFLHFDKVEICIRKHRWHIVVKSKCMFLGRDNRCTNYGERTDKCRRHNPPDCEKFAQWYNHRLSTPEELDEYLRS